MQCESCEILINPEFKFAIQKNNCPACGKQIMNSDKLAAFLGLRALLERVLSSGQKVDADVLATTLMANFEIKQSFQIKQFAKSEKKENLTNKEIEVEETEVVEDDPEQVFDEQGIKYEKPDNKKYKDMLQKMRDEALDGALGDRDIDFTDQDMALFSDGEARQEYILKQKREKSRQALLSGNGFIKRNE